MHKNTALNNVMCHRGWELLLLLADIYLTLLRLTVERWNEKWWCDMRNKKQHNIHKNWVCPALYAGDSTTLMSNCCSSNQDVKESRVLKVNCLLLKNKNYMTCVFLSSSWLFLRFSRCRWLTQGVHDVSLAENERKTPRQCAHFIHSAFCCLPHISVYLYF